MASAISTGKGERRMTMDVEELEARLAEVTADAASAETLTRTDYGLIYLVTLVVPAILLVVGWYL
jgi:hypothetical protein